MTNPNKTYLAFILDESGSMSPFTGDTVAGFNGIIAKQKEVAGECLVSVTKFSNMAYEALTDCPIASVPLMEAAYWMVAKSPFDQLYGYTANLHLYHEPARLTYSPAGGTALLDAMGQTIVNIGQKLAAMRPEDRPGKVIVTIMTDGEENSSRVYRNADEIRKMVEHQKSVYNWEFVFIGKDINAVESASTLGIGWQHALQYDGSKSAQMYEVASNYLSTSRTLGSAEFTANDRNSVITNPTP